MEFEEYFRERRLALFRFAVVLTGNPALADELVSDVLGKAFERWAQVAAADNVHAYVRRMVVNEYLGWHRRRARTAPVADLTAVADPARDQGDAYGDHQELVGELRRLPAKQRAAVVLRYYEGLSFAEIAAELGSGENAVRSNISRALARLRIAMTDSAADQSRGRRKTSRWRHADEDRERPARGVRAAGAGGRCVSGRVRRANCRPRTSRPTSSCPHSAQSTRRGGSSCRSSAAAAVGDNWARRARHRRRRLDPHRCRRTGDATPVCVTPLPAAWQAALSARTVSVDGTDATAEAVGADGTVVVSWLGPDGSWRVGTVAGGYGCQPGVPPAHDRQRVALRRRHRPRGGGDRPAVRRR